MKTRNMAVILLIIFMTTGLAFAGEPPGNAGSGSLSGRFVDETGNPLSEGTLLIFAVGSIPPSQDDYWHVPDVIKPLDERGSFSIDLPEGSYFLAGLKRLSGSRIGPPRSGDLFCISTDERGKKRSYSVRSGEKKALGKVAEARPYIPRTSKTGSGMTAIRGRIVDDKGHPVENALVFASTTSGMAAKPLFASDPTGEDGHFLLRLHDSGTFYLKARSQPGATTSGESIGMYGEKPQIPVGVKKGETVDGIVIRMARFSRRGSQQSAPGTALNIRPSLPE